MDQSKIKDIIISVLKEMDVQNEKKLIPIEASAKHAHLCKEDVEKLFGQGYKLTPKRELSQPGEFLSEERITIIGPKGLIKNVAVLGPERDKTQVEMSKTDSIILGIKAPLRYSGDTNQSADIFISAGKNIIEVKEAAIIAKRHIHMTPDLAQQFDLKDKQIVSVRVLSNRPVIFENVLVRVNENYRLNMHLDFDEANACNLTKDTRGEILA